MAFNRYTPQLPDLLKRQQTDPTLGSNIGIAPNDTTANTTYDTDVPIPPPSDLRQALAGPEMQQAPGKFMPDVNIPPGLPVPKAPKPSLVAPRTARDAYMAAVNTPPNEADYKPSKLTRLGAIFAGASTGWSNPGAGAEVAEHILSRGYDTAKSEYQDRLKNLATSANLEREQNQDEFERQKFGVTSGQEDTRIGFEGKRVSQEDQRIQIAKDQLAQQGKHLITDMNGHTIILDEKGGPSKDLGKWLKSDDESRVLAIQDEARKHGYRMQEIGAEQAGSNWRTMYSSDSRLNTAKARISAAVKQLQANIDKGDTVSSRLQQVAYHGINPYDYADNTNPDKIWILNPPPDADKDPNGRTEWEAVKNAIGTGKDKPVASNATPMPEDLTEYSPRGKGSSIFGTSLPKVGFGKVSPPPGTGIGFNNTPGSQAPGKVIPPDVKEVWDVKRGIKTRVAAEDYEAAISDPEKFLPVGPGRGGN